MRFVDYKSLMRNSSNKQVSFLTKFAFDEEHCQNSNVNEDETARLYKQVEVSQGLRTEVIFQNDECAVERAFLK